MDEPSEKPLCEGCGFDGRPGTYPEHSWAHCHKCHENVHLIDVLDHFETCHLLKPDRWPDGDLVVVDATLEPEDFR